MQQVFELPLKIIVDTREQWPLFSYNIIHRKLDEGDYNLIPLEDKYVFERKSPIDLYGSIIQNHVRFTDMLTRARLKGKRVYIFVECSQDDFFSKRFRGGDVLKVPSGRLYKVVKTMEEKYGLVIVWCANHLHARAMLLATFKLLLRKECGSDVEIGGV